MIRTPLGWAGLGAGFVLVLLYLTVVSSPPPPPSGVAHTGGDAAAACERAVVEQVPDARFPFAANVAYLGEARYRLSGTVEAVLMGETVRRNYECVVTYAAGTYGADSIRVWQSH